MTETETEKMQAQFKTFSKKNCGMMAKLKYSVVAQTNLKVYEISKEDIITKMSKEV